MTRLGLLANTFVRALIAQLNASQLDTYAVKPKKHCCGKFIQFVCYKTKCSQLSLCGLLQIGNKPQDQPDPKELLQLDN